MIFPDSSTQQSAWWHSWKFHFGEGVCFCIRHMDMCARIRSHIQNLPCFSKFCLVNRSNKANRKQLFEIPGIVVNWWLIFFISPPRPQNCPPLPFFNHGHKYYTPTVVSLQQITWYFSCFLCLKSTSVLKVVTLLFCFYYQSSVFFVTFSFCFTDGNL